MKQRDLVEHRAQLNARLDAIEGERAQIVRKLKAIDVLLEEDENLPPGKSASSPPGRSSPGRIQHVDAELVTPRKGTAGSVQRKRGVAPHAVRVSPRSSLIDAVHQVACKQLGEFDSVQLLKTLQGEFPEFKLSETKHISSPLSDLVKRGALVVVRKRIGNTPNIYRAVADGARTP